MTIIYSHPHLKSSLEDPPENPLKQILEQAIANEFLVIARETCLYDARQLLHQALKGKGDHRLGEGKKFVRSCYSCILVMAESRLVGILTESDLLRLLVSEPDLRLVQVADVMTQPVVTIARSQLQDLATPLDLLCKYHCSHLPILDEYNYPIGIVTLKYLVQAASLATDDWRNPSLVSTGDVPPQAVRMSQLQQLNQNLENQIKEHTHLLVNTENQLNLIVSNISDGILIVNQEGRIVFANPSAGNTFGMPVEQLLGSPIGVPNVLNNQFEMTHFSSDGKTGESELNVVTIEWNGEPAYLISLHDITERRLAEARLLKIQADLEEAQKIAHVGSWEFDVNTQKLAWSDEMYRLFGLIPDRHDLTCEEVVSHILPKDWQILNRLVERAIQFGESYKLDLQIIKTDGSLGYLFIRGTPTYDHEGKICGLFGTAIDISDRKANESMLRRYERVVAATTDAIILYSPDYRYQLVNQVYLDWHGMQQKDVIGRSVVEVLGKEAFEQTIRPSLDRCFAGEVLRYEGWLNYQDGCRRFVRITYSPYIEIDGNITGVLASLHDLTELKQTELQLQLTNEELSRATRLKDEFLANMSHELRTPLNAILGLAETLQEQVFGGINEKQRKALQTIESSGDHLLALINDILDVAKIEAGQMQLEFAPTNVESLCQSSLVFIKQQSLKKHLQLEVKLPEYLPHQMLDERRIRQVLINLLNNAMKFTPAGGKITLEVSKQREELHGKDAQATIGNLESIESLTKSLTKYWLRFAVTDTGIGIAPEHIDKLFHPFTQIDSALNRQYAGTGLGLAIVRRIVELHDGRVGLQSSLGKGSCFTFELPYTADAFENRIDRQFADLRTSNSALINLAPEAPLILIAEDNEANISTISSYLEARGYRLLLAKNGQDAIALAIAQRPELILMDVQMPIIDGLEAMRQIRLEPALAHTPIIALTALTMEGDRDRCLAAGANEYLAKPVKLKQLTSIIQGFLQQS